MFRRYKQDCIFLKRIRRWSNQYWYNFSDINRIKIQNPIWVDFIGLKHIYLLKKTKTRKWDTRSKNKWGKKGIKNYFYSSDYNTRIKDKNRFKKELLNEYGYR